MNTKKSALIAALCFFVFRANAGLLLTDDFNSNSLDTNKWISSKPFADSDVYESNGFLTLAGRGYLTARNQYSPSAGLLDISLKLKSPSPDETFAIATRSDSNPSYALIGIPNVGCCGEVQNGIVINIYTNNYLQGGIGITRKQNDISTLLASSVSMVDLGVDNVLRVTDDGSNINFYINGSLALSAYDTTVYSLNYITFYDRENGGWMNNSSLVDYVNINAGTSSVPTPATVLLLASGIPSLIFFVRKGKRGQRGKAQ